MLFRPAMEITGFWKLRQRLHQRQALLLIVKRLAVLQRQIDELPLNRLHRGIKSVLERMRRRFARQCIGSECARTAAKHIAGKLIEHNDHREAGLCLALPMHQLTRRSEFIGIQKAAADFVIDRRILFELGRATLAAFLARAKPEGQDCFGALAGRTFGTIGICHDVADDRRDWTLSDVGICAL